MGQEKPVEASGAAVGRRCFVTVGATASFRRLLCDILEPEFLDCLGSRGFGELIVQTGPDHAWALARIESLGTEQPPPSTSRPAPSSNKSRRWPVIQAVSYSQDLQALMLPCRGEANQQRRPGAMISHAGSGSILDAVRCDVPLIVVANPDLLGNHQEELADAVDEAGWAIKGTLGHLSDAIVRVLEKTRDIHIHDISPYQPPPFPAAVDERCGLFEWAALYAAQSPTTASTGINTLTLD